MSPASSDEHFNPFAEVLPRASPSRLRFATWEVSPGRQSPGATDRSEWLSGCRSRRRSRASCTGRGGRRRNARRCSGSVVLLDSDPASGVGDAIPGRATANVHAADWPESKRTSAPLHQAPHHDRPRAAFEGRETWLPLSGDFDDDIHPVPLHRAPTERVDLAAAPRTQDRRSIQWGGRLQPTRRRPRARGSPGDPTTARILLA